LAGWLVLALLRGLAGVALVTVHLTEDAGKSDDHVSTAQVPAVDVATLTGTAYRLVDQTVVDGVVIDDREVPITDGRIAIPELGIDIPLAEDGSFHLSDLPASADPGNPTEVTVIFTAPGLGSFTYLHLRLYPGHVGPNLTPQLIDTPRVDDLSRGHRGTGPALP